jgi:hypothetical protein
MAKTRAQTDNAQHVYTTLLVSANKRGDILGDRKEKRINYLIRLADKHGESLLLRVRKKAENDILKLEIRFAQKHRLNHPALGENFSHGSQVYPYKEINGEIINALEIVRAINSNNHAPNHRLNRPH